MLQSVQDFVGAYRGARVDIPTYPIVLCVVFVMCSVLGIHTYKAVSEFSRGVKSVVFHQIPVIHYVHVYVHVYVHTYIHLRRKLPSPA